jgi:hypothetical protein
MKLVCWTLCAYVIALTVALTVYGRGTEYHHGREQRELRECSTLVSVGVGRPPLTLMFVVYKLVAMSLS